MFIRFVCAAPEEGLRARSGVFRAAYELRDSEDLDQHTHDFLDEHITWFRENLAIPDRFAKGGSRNAEVTRGLSWFKADAEEAIGRVFDMIPWLEMHGHSIEMLRTARPGYIVYEDEHQVVAEPFTDTPV